MESVPDKGSDFSVFLRLPEASMEEHADVQTQTAVKTEEADYEDAFRGRRILLAEDIFADHDEGYYDFILMDVQMPEMDGYEATRVIRASGHPQAKTIPIYAMTANAFTEDISAALNAGMNGHIAKPIDTDILYATLKKAVQSEQNA